MSCCINLQHPFIKDTNRFNSALNRPITSCGLLILIHHLISTKMPKQLKMADDLLRNIHRNRIAVNPPSRDAALAFITHMVNHASHIQQNDSEWQKNIQLRAASLLEAAQELQQNTQSSEMLNLFERRWNEFSILYLETKLFQLMQIRQDQGAHN